MLRVGDTVRIDGHSVLYQVVALSEGWEDDTWTITVEGGGSRMVMPSCWVDSEGHTRDANGDAIEPVKPVAAGVPDALEDEDQIGLF